MDLVDSLPVSAAGLECQGTRLRIIAENVVNAQLEMADMREAQRSHEVNLEVIQSSRAVLQRTVDLLR